MSANHPLQQIGCTTAHQEGGLSMFGFWRRSAPRALPDAIHRAITGDGMSPSVGDPSRLRMVEVGGRYSDRKVTYFRVFDPTAAAQQTLDIRRYQDFDVFPGLVVRSGHVERDGTIVLTRPVGSRAPDAPVRTRAGRVVPNLEGAAAGDAVVAGAHVTGTATPSAGPTS
jgi:hypothetical protein